MMRNAAVPRSSRHTKKPMRTLSRIGSIPWRRYARCAIAFASAAARCMLDDISLVTVLCSSTAAAVAVTYSLTPWIAC